MRLWLTQHMQALKQVLARFKRNLLGTLLISLAIGVTLALPVILYVVLDNLGGLVSDVKKESHMSVFLKLNHDDAMLQNIKTVLEKNPAIKTFQFVSKEDALKQLTNTSNNEELINSLEENPLPDAFFIEPNSLDANAINSLKNELGSLEGVEEVQVDGAWIKRLNYLLALGKKAMLVLAILLGFALFAVIGNTIRMQILTQQEEIEVSHLVGATKGFIRRPFLYSGVLYGLFGGLFALLISCAVILLFNQSLTALTAEYQTNFTLNLPNTTIFLATCLLACIVGLVSAYLAVSKSLFKQFN
jgi:cell division transport system permease protein